MTDQPNAPAGMQRLLKLVAARRLPGIAQANAEGGPALAVEGEIFVQLLDPATALLHCPVDQKVLLMEISPDIYFETDRHVGRDIMLVNLDRIGDEELSLRLHDAWTFRAPERLRHGV